VELREPEARPKALLSKTYEFEMACGNDLYVTASYVPGDGNRLFEIFVTIGKMGSCHRALIEALGRSISYYLRVGGDPEAIAKTLRGIRCPYSTPNPDHPTSCPDAIARVIFEELNGGEVFSDAGNHKEGKTGDMSGLQG